MIHLKTIKTVILCLSFSLFSQAQTYTPPSQERVNTLLEDIEECKSNINELEERIKFMEANATAYTLAQYNRAKELLKESKQCKSAIKKELESIREDYPGWFNSPNASIPIERGKFIYLRDITAAIEDIIGRVQAAIESLGNLSEPEN